MIAAGCRDRQAGSLRSPNRALTAQVAFTIIELLIVMGIIVVLAGLILATSGYVQKKGARSRAEAEIAALSAGLESYKAENGIYPTAPETETFKPNSSSSVSEYQKASRYLYIQLTGDTDGNPTTPDTGKNYLGASLKPNMLSPNPPGAQTYIRDPFGNSYGYSTVKAAAPAGTDGYNPTFDLWSTGGVFPPVPADQSQWIKNW
ncbi:MAG: type II secretion system protein [Chthoniobacterales bacterium]